MKASAAPVAAPVGRNGVTLTRLTGILAKAKSLGIKVIHVDVSRSYSTTDLFSDFMFCFFVTCNVSFRPSIPEERRGGRKERRVGRKKVATRGKEERSDEEERRKE